MRVKTIIFEIDNVLSKERVDMFYSYLELFKFKDKEVKIYLQQDLTTLQERMNLEINADLSDVNLDEFIDDITDFYYKDLLGEIE